MRGVPRPRPLPSDSARRLLRLLRSSALLPQPTASATPAIGLQIRCPLQKRLRSIPLGVSLAPAKPDHCLHMKCLRKQIEKVHFGNVVALFAEYGQIARERGRLARYVGDPRGPEARQFCESSGLHACTRWVENNQIRPLLATIEKSLDFGGAHFDGAHTCDICFQVARGGGIRFYGDHSLETLREWHRKQAYAREE